MLELHDLCARVATEDGLAWLDSACREARAEPARLPALFPQLPRRLGRSYLSTGERRMSDDVVIDTGAWRACDAAALLLLHTLFVPHAAAVEPTDILFDLHERGDQEERTMVLRALACLPIGPWTGRLLAAAQRTNQVVHVAAGALDSNLLARTLVDEAGEIVDFDQDDFDRMMLRIAYLDLPLVRVFDAEKHASAELSRMLQGLATEREAAGRRVWHDTNRLIAHAPTAGTVARLIGGLECGDDEHRLAAAEGLATLGDHDLLRYVEERLPREDSPRVRIALQHAQQVLAG